MKVIALSALCIDLFPEQKLIKPGGNSLNFAIHAKILGNKDVAVAGYLGADDEAGQVLKLLQNYNIDTQLLYTMNGRTASNMIYNTPEGERYSNPGDWKDGVYNNFEFSELDFSKIFEYDLIAIPYTDKNLEKIIERNKSGKKIVVDFLHFDDPELIFNFLPFIEIAFVSAQKEKLGSLKDLAEKQKKLIVATLGADGSVAFIKDREYFQPALEVSRVFDTTGCGDAYQAAFCMSYFHNGNVQKAMIHGAREASKVLKYYGGVK